VQPKARILDVYGAFARDVGGWIAIADLIELLSYFEVDAQVVRSAASRMKRRGLLESRRVDGAAGYALSDTALEILHDGDARIFRGDDPEPATSWVVAAFSVPERERHKRYLIRSRLARLGFGQGPAATWFAPARILPDTERTLRRSELDSYVTLWKAEYAGFADFTELVAAAWDLDATRATYDDYLSTFRPVAEKWSHGEFSDQVAFVDYLGNLAAWRPLPYLDPGLPPSVTPEGWPGPAARAMFLGLERKLRPQAMRFFISVTRPSAR
jgi:phenylacetic acid degradation operon negative regulatory protein